MKSKNRIRRALDVQRIVQQHYVNGRSDRCKLWVYRVYIRPVYHISEATFFRYLKVKNSDPEPERKSISLFTQLSVFD